MKKISFLLLAFVVAFLGCSSRKSPKAQGWMEDTDKLRVLCTTAIVEDLVKQIGGDRVHTNALIKGEIDPHSYELVKGDFEKIAGAGIVFSSGLGLEHGASLVYALQQHPTHVPLGDVLRTDPHAILLLEGQIDPHIWMDVSLWIRLIDPIVVNLSALDPDGKSYFMENGQRTYEELLALDRKMMQILHEVPAVKRYLVTSHDAFNYFARRYLKDHDNELDNWQKRFSAPEGLAPDGQISIHDIDLMIQYLKAHDVQVLFPESNVSADSLNKIIEVAKDKNIPVMISKKPLYGDALGEEDSGASNYKEMMLTNARNIAHQLGGAHD